MKLEKEKARIVIYKDENMQTVSNICLGVRVDGKVYEIEGLLTDFRLDPIKVDDFCNIHASFGIYDLETVR